MPGILIIVVLFAVLWFAMIRPQRAKLQQQQRMLGTVAVGDEVLTVGGIYGIVQELEPDEDGGDLIVEIADGIHVRVARKALATVIKPDEDDEEDGDEDEEDAGDPDEGEGHEDAKLLAAGTDPAAGVEEVTNGEETVNPRGTAPTAPSEHS